MRSSFISLAILAMGLVMSACQGAAAVTLVKDGQPAATIVIAKAALEAAPYEPFRARMGTPESKIRLAANELRDYVKKMSGAELPIVGDDAAVNGAVVLVGTSAKTAGLSDVQIPAGLTSARREEGFTIATRGQAVVLAGNDAGPYHGTNYAVYDLLNRLGVRWFMPGEIGDVAPKVANIEVTVNLPGAQRPSFPLRTWWSNQTESQGKAEALWKLRNKMNLADTDMIGVPGDGYLRTYMPDKALMGTHPDLFAKTLGGESDPFMPNLSNPDAVKAVATNVVAKLQEAEVKGKRPHSTGFAPDDGIPMDFTPKTIKELNQGMPDWVGREGVPTEVSVSEEWLGFFNQVTAEVVKTYPDIIMTTNGYANRANPPVGVTLHPNVGIMYACIWADTTKPWNSPKSWHGHVQAAQLQRWTELSKFVFLYEYNLTMLVTALTPMPQMRKTAINYGMAADWGLFGFMNEARVPYMEEGIVTRYVRARLMWDAKQDLNALLEDFYGQWYGPAAAAGRGFWTDIEDALLESPLLGHEDRILPYIYTPKLLAGLEKHLANAERVAGAEPYKTRVRIDRLTLEHLKAYMAAADAEFDGRYADTAAAYQKMIDLRGEIAAISEILVLPPTKEGIMRYVSGETYWGILDRRDYFKKLADMTSGATGELLAMSPKKMRFALDEAAVGRDLKWFAPTFERKKWRDLDATVPFYAQGYQSADGVPYAGKMWYVTELEVPASAQGKKVQLYTPTLACEAWVWVNGQYVGHRPYLEAYIRPLPLEMDVTKFVKPGEKNTIALWVATGTGRTQAADGLLGRVFLYAPK